MHWWWCILLSGWWRRWKLLLLLLLLSDLVVLVHVGHLLADPGVLFCGLLPSLSKEKSSTLCHPWSTPAFSIWLSDRVLDYPFFIWHGARTSCTCGTSFLCAIPPGETTSLCCSPAIGNASRRDVTHLQQHVENAHFCKLLYRQSYCAVERSKRTGQGGLQGEPFFGIDGIPIPLIRKTCMCGVCAVRNLAISAFKFTRGQTVNVRLWYKMWWCHLLSNTNRFCSSVASSSK